MQRRAFLRHAAAGAVATWVRAAPPSRPDIVVILADDFAPDGLGAWGHPEVRTPNLDRLARRGMSFTQAYIQGSWTGAVCIASRTMLMTGLPLWRAQKSAADVAAADRAWPQRLRAAGYRTAFTGKWHIPGMKPEAVFEMAVRPAPGMPKDDPTWYGRPVEGQPDPFCPWDETRGGFGEGGRHWSERQADDGIALLRGAPGDARPLFLYQAFNAPHDPRQSPRAYCDMYPPGSVSVPPGFEPAHPDADAIGVGPSLRDEALAPSPRTRYAIETTAGSITPSSATSTLRSDGCSTRSRPPVGPHGSSSARTTGWRSAGTA